jgi:hypothetical protein
VRENASARNEIRANEPTNEVAVRGVLRLEAEAIGVVALSADLPLAPLALDTA